MYWQKGQVEVVKDQLECLFVQVFGQYVFGEEGKEVIDFCYDWQDYVVKQCVMQMCYDEIGIMYLLVEGGDGQYYVGQFVCCEDCKFVCDLQKWQVDGDMFDDQCGKKGKDLDVGWDYYCFGCC